MWKRFAKELCCPVCSGDLGLEAIEQNLVELPAEVLATAAKAGHESEAFRTYVDFGLLSCDGCKVVYPIWDGLPVFSVYETGVHKSFAAKFSDRLPSGYRFPSRQPEPGETFVMDSFSVEWADYEYDEVIWEMSYEDHEKRFLEEVGMGPGSEAEIGRFLEIGCGIGITTHMAQRLFAADAVGVDLSLAVAKANRKFRDNPHMHFLQASAFHLPLRPASFDLVYSRGVLHHTCSTQRAFTAVAPQCRPKGLMYLWVYGSRSISDNLFRRTLFLAEAALRPVLSKQPDSPLATLVLGPLALAYKLFNRLRRFSDPTIQPLTLGRALHAARDRFTPRYAHRHEPGEVCGWFEGAGFRNVEVVDWRRMPTADHDDYRRNVGVRGVRLAE